MELEECIKSLKEFAYTMHGTFSQKEDKLILKALDNSIPKEKVKKKIENLKKKANKYESNMKEGDLMNYWHNNCLKINHKIQGLQELLDE